MHSHCCASNTFPHTHAHACVLLGISNVAANSGMMIIEAKGAWEEVLITWKETSILGKGSETDTHARTASWMCASDHSVRST
jgi:hypothetical protein